jgi:hypothetical protein
VVQRELVEPQRGQLVQPLHVAFEVRRDEHLAPHVFRLDVLRRRIERRGHVEVPAHGRVEDVGAPLVVGDAQGLVLRRRPREVDLQHEAALPAAGAIGVDHPPQVLDGRVDGGEPVGPAAGPARGGLAHRGADERRRLVGQRPQPGAVDHDESAVADLLAREQSAHHVDALAQPRVALVLGGPPVAGDVLVGGLAAAEGDPQATREHLGQRRGGLRDDRGVIALARRVDDAEGQAPGGQGRAQERPREARFALARAPGREVV